MIEYIVLGIIQGIAEWLPISSEGMIVLVQSNFFGAQDLAGTIHVALFLHLGTFLAALFYFRRDIIHLISSVNLDKSMFQTIDKTTLPSVFSKNKVLGFLAISFLISGMLGLLLVTL